MGALRSRRMCSRDRRRFFDAAVRQRGPGDGLGLAIVDALMRQAGAEFEMASPAEGQADGFEIRLQLSRCGLIAH